MSNPIRTLFGATVIGVTLALIPLASLASELPAAVAGKVEAAKKRLQEMASDAAVIAAVREANGRDSGGMNNGKWSDLADGDATVKAVTGSKVSLQLAKWETADDNINKLVLRDQKGNLVGASTRPLLFNNATRPQFANPMKGQAWAAPEVKPDPTTQVPSVQLGVPVMDAGKAIGVLHVGVTAK